MSLKININNRYPFLQTFFFVLGCDDGVKIVCFYFSIIRLKVTLCLTIIAYIFILRARLYIVCNFIFDLEWYINFTLFSWD